MNCCQRLEKVAQSAKNRPSGHTDCRYFTQTILVSIC